LTGKYPPFSFYSDQGELAGFDVDVARMIAGHLGREISIVATEWDGILAGLLSGKYDAIIGSMAITPERRKMVRFSDVYYVSGAQLFIHASSEGRIRHIRDLEGRRVGVGLGETYEHYLRSTYPAVETVTYKSTVDIFQDMRNGRLEGFVTDRLVGLYQIESGGLDFVPAGPLLYREEMGIPVRMEDERLLRQINRALRGMRSSGEMDRLHAKWFGEHAEGNRPSGGMTWSVQLRMLGRGFVITLAVALSALVMGFILAIPWGIVLNNPKVVVYVPLRFFNDFIRGTPLLIQLFFVYFGAPQVGVTLSPIGSAVLTLTISCAAYMAEAIRSGLMAVDPGQQLAGKALALSRIQIFRFIVWPQAFRVSIPSLMNIVVAFIKDTALISVISVAEVVREAQSIISVTYNPIRYYFIVGLMFFLITFPLMKLAGYVERRIKQRGYVHD
jgi:His/Glu/Gln/Arg/opine family amino acid ABC transporter permease subunit